MTDDVMQNAEADVAAIDTPLTERIEAILLIGDEAVDGAGGVEDGAGHGTTVSIAADSPAAQSRQQRVSRSEAGPPPSYDPGGYGSIASMNASRSASLSSGRPSTTMVSPSSGSVVPAVCASRAARN